MGIIIDCVRHLSAFLTDKDFVRELEEYLSSVEYDKKEIQQERNKILHMILNDEKDFAIASGQIGE